MVRVKTSVDKNASTWSNMSRSAIDNSSPSPKRTSGKNMAKASAVAGSDQWYESISSPKLPNTSNAMNTGASSSPTKNNTSADVPRITSRDRSASERRSSSIASSSGKNVNTMSIPKRHRQGNTQRSRSLSAATGSKKMSSGTSKRSRSVPASRKSTVASRTRVSFKAIVRKIAKAVDPSAKLSPMAERVLDSFINDMLRRLAVELKRLCEQTGQRTVSTDDVRFAISLLLTGDLLLHALEEGNRAVARYRLLI